MKVQTTISECCASRITEASLMIFSFVRKTSACTRVDSWFLLLKHCSKNCPFIWHSDVVLAKKIRKVFPAENVTLELHNKVFFSRNWIKKRFPNRTLILILLLLRQGYYAYRKKEIITCCSIYIPSRLGNSSPEVWVFEGKEILKNRAATILIAVTFKSPNFILCRETVPKLQIKRYTNLSESLELKLVSPLLLAFWKCFLIFCALQLAQYD